MCHTPHRLHFLRSTDSIIANKHLTVSNFHANVCTACNQIANSAPHTVSQQNIYFSMETTQFHEFVYLLRIYWFCVSNRQKKNNFQVETISTQMIRIDCVVYCLNFTSFQYWFYNHNHRFLCTFFPCKLQSRSHVWMMFSWNILL